MITCMTSRAPVLFDITVNPSIPARSRAKYVNSTWIKFVLFNQYQQTTNVQVVPVRTINHKFLFGSGKVSEMSGIVAASEADAVFVNAPLSGAQQKALGDLWGGATVLDRFRVILDIFADRARTTEAKLQVTDTDRVQQC